MSNLNEKTALIDAIKKIIKEELKKNLKVNTSIQFPNTFSDGNITTNVFYDDDLIYSDQDIIKRGATLFSL